MVNEAIATASWRKRNDRKLEETVARWRGEEEGRGVMVGRRSQLGDDSKEVASRWQGYKVLVVVRTEKG